MSRYDYYAGSYGKPVSIDSYDAGRGTRPYVTRVEERVEQVRRPSTTGYAYYSAVKAEKDGRPREVNDFITKLLDEVTTTRSLEPLRVYGRPAKEEESTRDGRDGRRVYYEAEYTYVGPRNNNGDPFDQRRWSTHVSSHPPQYRDPKNRWETSSSLPIYDALPYDPPSVESYSSKGYYGARPEAKDYDVPTWARSSTKATSSPTDYGNYYGDSNSSKKNFDRRQAPNGRSLDIRGDYSLAKPYSSDRYGILDNGNGGPTSPKYDQWDNDSYYSPSKPTYHTPSYEDDVGGSNVEGRDPYRAKPSSLGPQSPKNYGLSDNLGVRSSSPNYDPVFAARHPNRSKSSSLGPQSPKTYGVSDNQGVRSTTPNYDPVFEARDPNRSKPSSLGPQSPKNYGVSDNQGVRSSSPNYDPSPHKPRFDQATPPQSPKPNRVSENQWDNRSSSPEYEHPPRNNLVGGVPSNNRWGNSPLKTQTQTQTQTPSTPSPVYSNTPKNDGFPRGQTGRSVSPEYEHPPRNEILCRAPSNRWDKSDDPSLKVQIPRDDAYNEQKNLKPNVAVRDGVPAYGNNAYDPEPTGNRIYTKS